MSRRSSRRPYNPSVMKSPVSFVATLLVLYFLVPIIVLPFVNALGGIGEIITDLIDLIPFGDALYWLAVQILNAVAGQAVNYASIQGVFTFGYVFQELAEGIFTVIIYEALCLLMSLIMGLDSEARWVSLKRLAVNVAMAIISACLAPALINWTFANMSSLGTTWKAIISSLISWILLGGGVAFFVFLKEFTIAVAIAYVALKFVVVGSLRLIGSYVFLFLILLGFQTGAFWLLLSGSSGLLLIAVLLAGIELMIRSIFE